MAAVLGNLRSAVAVVRTSKGDAVATGGTAGLGPLSAVSPDSLPLLAYLPPLHPAQLGDPGFLADHGLQYPYMTGAMANGIASVEIVEAMSRAGMLGSFGAAGLSVARVTAAVERMQSSLAGRPYCVNLIHSPGEPAHEMAVAELLIRRGVERVEASAYLDLSPAIVRYRLAGLSVGPDGGVVIRNRVIAKVSRVEVATRFLSPAPARIVAELVASGQITEQQAQLAQRVPMCDDLTGEADSGGHTDNRPAITLLPTLLALRDRLQAEFRYTKPVRVGLAGGIATPASVAAAFGMGAAYVVTGSVNQACLESGSSHQVRRLLAEAGQADVTMAPAADMFELGVKLQVLKRGTMFPMRAGKLYEIYRQYPEWAAVPAGDRAQVEKNLFRASYEEVWKQTREFWLNRDPTQLPRAETDPKHQMALVFRWYLGLSSRWANIGEPDRQVDYQIWCGPAMGAFNEWAKGSPLESPQHRTVVGIALNLLYGACLQLRRAAVRQQGVKLPDSVFPSHPLSQSEVENRLG
ncbi:MAG: PfaD family polyunsaturated fatty acid/polyketide biosynthesis protein [Bacteroidales bacterium]|nr:PfaD family polyunsaturated fatty acid/polyketide biosynthesis protein [Bacteroidales bacterium]